MVTFKTMWNDVLSMELKNKPDIDNRVMMKFKNGFVIKNKDNNNEVIFITKDDFVDFWCKLLCNNQVTKNEVRLEDENKMLYVYSIIKKLPYIAENDNILKLVK